MGDQKTKSTGWQEKKERREQMGRGGDQRIQGMGKKREKVIERKNGKN